MSFGKAWLGKAWLGRAWRGAVRPKGMMMAPDAREIAAWLEKYDHARRSFVHGFVSRIEAVDALRNLRFRDDALRVEILEWERAKAVRARSKRNAARHKLEDYFDERTPTPPSSV